MQTILLSSHLQYIHADSALKFSTKKTKLMRINANNNNAVVIDGQEVKDVDSFD